MELGTTFKPLAISLFTALILAACGGGGDGGVADNSENIPKGRVNNQIKHTETEEWRRIDGFERDSARNYQKNLFRLYVERRYDNLKSRGTQPPPDIKSYYFNGGNGLHHDTLPNGGVVDYRNMSYATFGNYTDIKNNIADPFYTAKITAYVDMPKSGIANYAGPILYHGVEDGRIIFTANFSAKMYGLKTKVENSSLFNYQEINFLDSNIYNHISGMALSNDKRFIASFSGYFAGPNAEEIVGTISNTRTGNEASFGATRQ